MIITLCGSSKYKKEFEEINKKLTLEGHIVISLGIFGHADKIILSPEQKYILDQIHFQKINLSDAIYVINKDGYIGQSTNNEIQYAKSLNKKIYYLEEN